MSQKTNLKAAPYFDDFDPQKDFYRILFRPSYPIQSRELNSLQSLLQNQIESYGKFQFKQGDLVVPGEVGINTRLDYIKLSSVSEVPVNIDGVITYQKFDITNLINQQIAGLSSGVAAVVLSTNKSTDNSSDTIYVKYLNGGDSGNETKFRQGETLEIIDGVNSPLLVVGTDGSVLPTTIPVVNYDTGNTSFNRSNAMGHASAVKIEEGIYFVNGFFVRNPASLIVIDKYYDKPSAKVGFKIVESLSTPEEDASLYDNSIGSSNYAAPGAHRLKISLEAVAYAYDASTDKNFIQLLTIKNGVIQKQIKPADYSLIESTLARRTYDESGDYVVDNFPLEIREYYQKNENLGIYSKSLDNTVNGLSESEASDKMMVSIGSGKAYVRGYEIVHKETEYYPIDKARDVLTRDNINIKSKGLSEFKISNVYNSIPLNPEGADLTAYPTVYLNSVFNDGSTGFNNTESSTTHKQTTSRRSSGFGKNEAVKTIYLQITSATFGLGTVSNASILEGTPGGVADLKNLWFVQTRTQTGAVSTVDKVSGISFAKVTRPEFGDVNAQYLEVTVVGRKDQLLTYFKEYDDNEVTKLRKIYLTQSDAQQELNSFGFIRDYNEVITPIIGVCKPKDFKLLDRPDGFNQDSDIVISKGRLSDGTTLYNGVFGFSYFNPVFFTKILLDSPITSNFSSGKYIYGTVSGAYGVIEGETDGYLSSGNNLFVKTLYGNFVAGESIVSESGSTLRIATENTISHFVVTKSGVGYSQDSYVSVNGVPYDTSKISVGRGSGGVVYRLDIINRDSVSAVYSNPPSIAVVSSTTPSSNISVSPVLFRNTVLTYSPQNVKSFYSVFGSGNVNKFTADTELLKTKYSSTSQITEFTFSGTKGYKFLECNGFGADASTQLLQGDIIQFSDDTGRVNRVIVQYATSPEGTSKSKIYLDNSLPDSVSSSSVVRLRPTLSNTTGSSLIFPTGSKEVGSLISSTEDTKIKYYFRRDFVTTGSSSGGSITFAAQLPFGTQRFVSFNESDFLITVLEKGNSNKIQNGDIIYISPEYIDIQNTQDSSGLSAGTISINFPLNYFGTNVTNFPKLKLTATVEVSKAKPKIKTSIENRRIVISAFGDRVIPLRGQNYDTDDVEISSYSDAYKLKYIYEGSAAAPPTVDVSGNLVSGTDLTNRFTFDDGQRDTFYDVSRIILKPGFDAPTGQLVVCFDYFEHSQGDFCTIDSYIHESGVLPEEIPVFNSSVHGVVSLKNVIDFRPKSDSSTSLSGFQDKSILSQTDYISFTGSAGAISSTPASDSRLEYTVSFTESQYLDRIDAVFLSKTGEFLIKSGNSSLNPTKPDFIDDAIALYYLYIPAFTKTSKDVRVIPVDNKRYTMRDIGKLEKRIERLEYYTTLSILEQQALNMQVKDALGLDRIKSGFIVDNFETHKIGNLKSIDYRCSVDTQQSVLRPQSKEDSIKLVEVYTREDERNIARYKNNNGVISLPFTNVVYAKNPYATKTINPNPFVVLQYVGDVSLSPNIDQWYDTAVAPLVTDNNTGLFSIFLAKKDVRESFSSIYNSFVINWIGSDRSFYNINSFANTNSSQSSSSVEIASVSSSSNISPQNNEIAKGVGYKTINNNSVVDSLRFFARSVPVKFVVSRLKPKTQIYVFMEKRDIGRWVIPDARFTGVAGNSLLAFNSPITTDEYGNASGIILIPAGTPPRENATWPGDINTLEYDTIAEQIRFSTGIKTIRFTSSSSDADKDTVDSYTEVKYYATGILPENPVSVISTTPAFFKANEGVQIVDKNTANKEKPNPFAQTLTINNFDGGLFATGVDLFFSKKSNTIPLRVYISNVDSGKPGKYVVPGSEKTLYPNTLLKIYASGNLTITKGEKVYGVKSNASGPIYKVLDKNNIEVGATSTGIISLTNEQVYTLVLSNNNGISFQAGEDLRVDSITNYNNKNNETLLLKIAKNSGKISELIISSVGSGYESATITVESPQLPGGSNATGSVKVSGGKIYLAELGISGRGYTEAPSIVIRSTGSSASGAVIESRLVIEELAVTMGISTDVTGTTESIIPTKFEFDYPVYLQNDNEYTLCIETDTTEYELWTSRLGETDKSTGVVVNSQPLLGSVYKSQNIDNWTEDLFEDIKFTLYRAQFDISTPAQVLLKNNDLGYEKMEIDPIETFALSNTNATSTLFKNNNSVVKVRHRDNGFEDSGNSYVYFKSLTSVGGYTNSSLNNALYKVSNSGVDFYNIIGPSRASSNQVGGGSSALVSYNRKYEKLYAQIPYLQAAQTKIDSFVRTTNIVPVDSSTQNYTSYSLSTEETTFLNQEQFFLNQKVVASKINETLNNTGNSLQYRLTLSSNQSHLSPIIDIRNCSVKTISNRIENATGFENRFGKRYQKLSFYPIYKFTVVGNGAVAINSNQVVKGLTSGAEAEIVRVQGNEVYVKIKNSTLYAPNEKLFFATQSQSGANLYQVDVFITTAGTFEQSRSFINGASITAFNSLNTTEKYDNKITGKIILWDPQTRELVIENDKNPIDNDYTSKITLGSNFARTSITANQSPDIFRVGDLIYSDGVSFNESKFTEVKSMSFSEGIQFVSEEGSANSSAIAKYVTKEISINSPASSIDVRMTVNVKDISNIMVLYKIKPASSEQDFDSSNWEYFNGDGSPDILEIATPENSISGQFEKQSSYQELKYSKNDMTEFSSFAIKIVMKTNDPAYIPKIQDLRAVASY